MRILISGLTGLFVILALLCHETDAKATVRVFPLTFNKTEQIVVSWLNNNQFKISFAHPVRRFVQISAEKEEIKFRIELSLKSASATRVEIIPGRKADWIITDSIWAYLDGHVRILKNRPANTRYNAPAAVAKHRESVVCIHAYRNGNIVRLTGFVIDRQGLIVATAHDLVAHQSLCVQFSDGNEGIGEVIGLDIQLDLSLINVHRTFNSRIAWDRGRRLLRNGDALFAIQCSGSGSYQVESGFVTEPQREVGGLHLWQASIHVEPGSSGSPVFDTHGNLAAIIKGRFRDTNSVGFLIPLETLISFLTTR